MEKVLLSSYFRNLQTREEFILIPLDIFKKNTQNKPIETEMKAWLNT